MAFHGGFNMLTVCDIELALNVKMIYKLLQANIEIWNSVGKHYLQNLDSKYNIRYFLYTCSFLPNMNYSSVMSTFLCSNSMQLKLVLSKLCVYFHYWNIKSITVFNSLFIIKRKPIVVKSFILSKLLLVRVIWDHSLG